MNTQNKSSERLGEQISNEWGIWTIVEYVDSRHIICERDDGYRLKPMSYRQFKQGKMKGKNRYKILDDYGICYASNTKEEILFDLEDYDKIKNHSWHVATNEYGYKIAKSNVNGKPIKMHVLITNKKYLDHINGNSLDNRKTNLRESIDNTGYNRNSLNSKISRNNKSGHKGVHWDKFKNSWKCQIVYKGKLYTKSFKVFEDACKWIDNKRMELHGEYANLG